MNGFLPTWAHLQSLVQVCTGAMLNCIGAGLLLALLAWMVVRFIGRQSSGTRFAVWYVSLLAIAVLPGLSLGSSGSFRELAGTAGPHSAITLPHSWALDLFLLWAISAMLGLSKVAAGLWHLRQLRQSCVAVEMAELDPLPRQTWNSFAHKRGVKLLRSEQLAVPAAIGFVHPAVVIPAWSLTELSPTELNAVILHELAHLQRWDDWTNLAQKLLRALFFFHPAVWLVESQLSLAREMACDDVVLAATSSPRAYAECLVSLAEKSFLHRGLALAQAAVRGMRQTTLRVAQILEGNRPRTTGLRKPAIAALASLSVMIAFSLSQAPELVGFRDRAPAATAEAAAQPTAVRPAVASSLLQPVAASFEFAAKSAIHPRRLKAGRQSPLGEGVLAGSLPARPRATRQGPPSVSPTLASFQPASFTPDPGRGRGTAQMAPAEVLLVMQSYDPSGLPQLTICVWRVMMWTPSSSAHGGAGVPAKSI